MAGYTKLFNSILASTIWREPDHVRIVWITLLAMADARGVVETSTPGLADFARVSVEDCRDALKVLSSPDIDSRSQESEGRRIEAIDGGFRLINHAKYRHKLSQDERREYLRKKQREYRAAGRAVDTKSTNVNNVSDTDTVLTHTEAEAEAEAEADLLPAARAVDPERARKTPPAAEDRKTTTVTRPTAPPSPTAELADRAGRFVEKYAELYAQHRHGAKMFRRRPAIEWDQACELCRTWDDERLIKLAEILLTTDDDWVERTDRGWGVFVSRAQWCDERLSAWEAKQRRRA